MASPTDTTQPSHDHIASRTDELLRSPPHHLNHPTLNRGPALHHLKNGPIASRTTPPPQQHSHQLPVASKMAQCAASTRSHDEEWMTRKAPMTDHNPTCFAFDPDSDEFFDDAHAVYENFIDPGHGEQMVGEEEKHMLRQRYPMAIGNEDPAHLIVDDFHDLTHMDDSESTLTDPAVHRSSSAAVNHGFISYHDYAKRLPAPTPSAPIPVPAMRSRHSTSLDEHVLPSPSTPHFRETPVTHLSMSPPPSTTLLCLGIWSELGLVKDEDIAKVIALPDIDGDDEVKLADGWDCIDQHFE
ncbi:hypothetical protein BU15DRAFT_71841 [Melanogaster broomeanus]|nr:hypothetical protein BU15DRAFT_71841 [Melanogaster broomeanus]